VELRARADDGDVVLEVEDNGTGIAPEAREKVFSKACEPSPRDQS
jgi:signal transduction histidine kinase